MTIFDQFREALVQLTGRKIPLVVIGGLALSSYGYSRQTEDIDFLLSLDDLSGVDQVLKELNYVKLDAGEAFVRYSKRSEKSLPLDFVLVEKDTHQQVLKDAKTEKQEDIEYKVPSLLHLIALKLHALKNNPGMRKFKDMLDIAELVRKNDIDIKSEEVKGLFLKYGTTDLYQKFLSIMSST